jgi:hypothetical protein
MRALAALLVVAPATLLPCLPASAQDGVGIRPGARVRVFAADYAYEGTFVAFQADSMVVEPDGAGSTSSRAVAGARVPLRAR